MNKIKILLLFIMLTITTFASAQDFSSTYSIPIEMNILEEISTKNDILEGSILKFKIVKDVKYNDKTIVKRGEIVTGKVETIISKGMNGFPAEIILDNFEIPEINKNQLISTYTKKGLNLCLFVYPLKWALTPIPGVGSLTNFIMGGEAKIKPNDTIIIQYYPEWK